MSSVMDSEGERGGEQPVADTPHSISSFSSSSSPSSTVHSIASTSSSCLSDSCVTSPRTPPPTSAPSSAAPPPLSSSPDLSPATSAASAASGDGWPGEISFGDDASSDNKGGVARVSRACGHCKKAKARCDLQRPCNRCVRTGKEDSCVDSVHQKRGRKQSNPAEREQRQHPSQALTPAYSMSFPHFNPFQVTSPTVLSPEPSTRSAHVPTPAFHTPPPTLASASPRFTGPSPPSSAFQLQSPAPQLLPSGASVSNGSTPTTPFSEAKVTWSYSGPVGSGGPFPPGQPPLVQPPLVQPHALRSFAPPPFPMSQVGHPMFPHLHPHPQPQQPLPPQSAFSTPLVLPEGGALSRNNSSPTAGQPQGPGQSGPTPPPAPVAMYPPPPAYGMTPGGQPFPSPFNPFPPMFMHHPMTMQPPYPMSHSPFPPQPHPTPMAMMPPPLNVPRPSSFTPLPTTTPPQATPSTLSLPPHPSQPPPLWYLPHAHPSANPTLQPYLPQQHRRSF